MAQGYPSKQRARRAFERGVATGYRKSVARCPYDNPKLAELWERGRQMGLNGRRPQAGAKVGPPGRVVSLRETAAPAPRRPFAPRPAFGGSHHSHGAFRRDGGRRGGWR